VIRWNSQRNNDMDELAQVWTVTPSQVGVAATVRQCVEEVTSDHLVLGMWL
jgi:hypothetical protein